MRIHQISDKQTEGESSTPSDGNITTDTETKRISEIEKDKRKKDAQRNAHQKETKEQRVKIHKDTY